MYREQQMALFNGYDVPNYAGRARCQHAQEERDCFQWHGNTEQVACMHLVRRTTG
jgi:hypothetical protein